MSEDCRKRPLFSDKLLPRLYRIKCLDANKNYMDMASCPAPLIKNLVMNPERLPDGTPVGYSQAFPIKLYNMLDACEANNEASIVSWRDHGRGFAVQTLLSEEVATRLIEQ